MSDEILQKLRRSLLQIGERLREAAYDHAPKQSTDLARSHIVEESMEGDLAVRVGPTMDYGLYVHEGTGIHGPKKKPYTIKPRRKKALAFKFAGETIVRASVTQEGIEPNPWLEDAWDEIEDEMLDKLADDVGEEILHDLEKTLRKGW